MSVGNVSHINTIEDLMKISFKITYDSPTMVHWPQKGKIRKLEMHFIPSLARKYDVNNGIMVFRTNEAAYVVPYHWKFEQILYERGFFRKGMYVPFSNWDYPENKKEEWDNLVESVKKLQD